jgi:hypothetical protein
MATETSRRFYTQVPVDIVVIEPDEIFTMRQIILPWLYDDSRPGYFCWRTWTVDDRVPPPPGFDRFDYRFWFSDANLALEFKMRFG